MYHSENNIFGASASKLWNDVIKKLEELTSTFIARQTNYGVYSSTTMGAAGFIYTGVGDTAVCKECDLKVSNWTLNKKPFSVHVQQSPQCSYVKSMLPKSLASISTSVNYLTMSDNEKPSKRQEVEENEGANGSIIFEETATVKEIRKRTFSHRPHRTSPSNVQMIEAGFFNCNVGDRVICLYCNLICQQWAPNIDNPWETHQRLSPKCPYVIATLKEREKATSCIVNEESANADVLRSNDIVHTVACHQNYIETSQRHASFETWPTGNAPPIDDFVRAGFFYTGTKTIVTCFYCNGTLQNCSANDSPMIEHARWFPHCTFAKQLCGVELHGKIQESRRDEEERERANDCNRQYGASDTITGRGQLYIPDENDDFVSNCDLYIACVILQKQIEHIDGKKENIVIPSLGLQQIRERYESTTTETVSISCADSHRHTNIVPGENVFLSSCVLCSTEENRLARIPCCHLLVCNNCDHSTHANSKSGGKAWTFI